MDQGPLTFEQAERAYTALERQRQAGQIDEESYRQQLNALQVLDIQGRTWMLQEGSGQWYVYQDEGWVAATPPGRQPAAPAPLPPAPSRQAAQTGGKPRVQRAGCLGVTLRIILWDLVWIGAAFAVYSLIGRRVPWTLVPVGLLAAASLVWWVRRMAPRTQEAAS